MRRDGSVHISPQAPLKDSTHTAGNRRCGNERREETTRDAGAHPQPMDTTGSERTSSKKQQRDAKRAEANRALMASPQLARWQLLAQRLLWTARKVACSTVWTAWMRSRTPEARLEARRRVRNVLWCEWTRPHIEPPPVTVLSPEATRMGMRVGPPSGLQILGARSLRDEYILKRARALLHLPAVRGLRHAGMSKTLWAWLGFRQEMDFNRIHKAARSPETAGLTTPTSARSRKKTRGGKK